VYAVGFERSSSFEAVGVDLAAYDATSGTIASGLYGAGIAFPHVAMDPSGNMEHPVGMVKFMRHLKNVVPMWRADEEVK
jgi:hypothetical protein